MKIRVKNGQLILAVRIEGSAQQLGFLEKLLERTGLHVTVTVHSYHGAALHFWEGEKTVCQPIWANDVDDFIALTDLQDGFRLSPARSEVISLREEVVAIFTITPL